MAAVRGHFKPEFLNRIDEIVVFHRSPEADIERIVDIQVAQLRTGSRDAGSASSSPPRRGSGSRRRATTPTSGRARSSGCCSARSPTRSRSRC